MSYRLRIILLSLGVLLGFGAGFTHLGHAREHRRGSGPCHEHEPGPRGHWRWEAE